MGVENLTTNEMGEGYRVVDGVEQSAVWLPLGKTEMEEVIKKALETNTSFPQMLAEVIKNWLSGGELSLEDLEQVAGGRGSVAFTQEVQQASLRSLDRYNGALSRAGGMILRPEEIMGGTVMCGW